MNYFIFKDGESIGPLGDKEIENGIRSGRFVPNDLACREGETGWNSLSLFFPTAAPQVAPSPFDPPPQARTPAYSSPPPQFGAGAAPGGSYQPGNAGQGPMNLAVAPGPAGMNPYANGDFILGPRIGAVLIDGAISIPLAVMAFIPFIGIIGAPLFCAYWISRDAIFGGQSVGKKVVGLRVVKPDGSPFEWLDSVKRNIIYLAALLMIIPWFGIFLHAIVAGPLGIVELIMVLTSGQRIGDRIGNTYVVRA